MGNTLGGKSKTTKIMKMNGETIKLKTPVNAGDVMKDYPGLVLLDSEMVKHYSIRAKPLEPQQELKRKRLYFLVELPKLPEEKPAARRVRSGINMTAKDRLESLMLARRSASDLTFMKRPNIIVEDGGGVGGGDGGVDPLRVKLRLPKAELERLMKESKDEGEAAEKIMKLCMEKSGGGAGGGVAADRRKVQWKDDGSKRRGKRVGFVPMSQSQELVRVEEHTWM